MPCLRIAKREAVYQGEEKSEAVQDEEEVKATGDRRGTSRQLMRQSLRHMLQTPLMARVSPIHLPSFSPPSFPTALYHMPRMCASSLDKQRKSPTHCASTLCRHCPQRRCHSRGFSRYSRRTSVPNGGALR